MSVTWPRVADGKAAGVTLSSPWAGRITSSITNARSHRHHSYRMMQHMHHAWSLGSQELYVKLYTIESHTTISASVNCTFVNRRGFGRQFEIQRVLF